MICFYFIVTMFTTVGFGGFNQFGERANRLLVRHEYQFSCAAVSSESRT